MKKQLKTTKSSKVTQELTSTRIPLTSVLTILPVMKDKVAFLLNRFKTEEWSGPAWYRIEEEKDGYPLEVTLEYFTTLDLGDGTSTEMDAEDLGKILPQCYQDMPHLKECKLGLIHSHHGMGAFFSGTDVKTAEKCATKEGLYFSTVVAHTGEPEVFGFSYMDRINQTHFVEGEIAEYEYDIVSKPEWVNEAKRISKKKKDNAPKHTNVYGFGERNQSSLWGNPAETITRGTVTRMLNEGQLVQDVVDTPETKEDIITEQIEVALDDYQDTGDFIAFKQVINTIDKDLNPQNLLMQKYYNQSPRN